MDKLKAYYENLKAYYANLDIESKARLQGFGAAIVLYGMIKIIIVVYGWLS